MVKSESCSFVSDSLRPHDYTVHGILQARIPEEVAFPFLQGIFLTQESNQGLLHCRWILYQLSYQGMDTKSVQSLCDPPFCLSICLKFSALLQLRGSSYTSPSPRGSMQSLGIHKILSALIYHHVFHLNCRIQKAL